MSRPFLVPWVGIEPTLVKNWVLNPAYLPPNFRKLYYNQLINIYLILYNVN